MRRLLVAFTLAVTATAGCVAYVNWRSDQYKIWKQEVAEYMHRRQTLNAKMNQMPPEEFQRESGVLDVEAGRLRIE